jgi:hypothetical protein
MEDLNRRCNAVDADHSSLLRRLLYGKKKLEKTPPKSMSYPNYSLAEGEETQVHEIWERKDEIGVRTRGNVVVDQCAEWEWDDRDKKILMHVPTGDLFQYSEKTCYPVAVAKGTVEDHPYTGKFLKKIGCKPLTVIDRALELYNTDNLTADEVKDFNKEWLVRFEMESPDAIIKVPGKKGNLYVILQGEHFAMLCFGGVDAGDVMEPKVNPICYREVVEDRNVEKGLGWAVKEADIEKIKENDDV